MVFIVAFFFFSSSWHLVSFVDFCFYYFQGFSQCGYLNNKNRKKNKKPSTLFLPFYEHRPFSAFHWLANAFIGVHQKQTGKGSLQAHKEIKDKHKCHTEDMKPVSKYLFRGSCSVGVGR